MGLTYRMCISSASFVLETSVGGKSPHTQEQAWLLEPNCEPSREGSVWEEGQKFVFLAPDEENQTGRSWECRSASLLQQKGG